jgi:hypothetical protein
MMMAAPQQRPLPLYGETARGLFDMNTRALLRLIERMVLDDALVKRNYRVERLKLTEGREHLRVIARQNKQEWLVGLVDIATERDRASVYHDLALWLSQMGFRPENTRLVLFGAKTPLDAPKQRLPRLFITGRVNGDSGEDEL